MRYFRVMPSVLVIIVVTRTMSIISKEAYTCDDISCQSWWKNLLMLQNVIVDPSRELIVSIMHEELSKK